MKWTKLISFLVAAVGIGMLCCCGPGLFGARLRNIQNGIESWSRGTFLALDLLGVLLIILSYFIYRGRNWARLVLMTGCIVCTGLAVVGGVWLGALVSNIVDDLFITGLLIWSIAGPLLLLFMLRHPQVIEEFSGRIHDPPAGGGGRMSACIETERQEPGPIASAAPDS